jgi:hypothetical protein
VVNNGSNNMISQEEVSWFSGLVLRLYAVPPPRPEEQNELQRALFEAQKSPAAWEVVGHFLQTWEVHRIRIFVFWRCIYLTDGARTRIYASLEHTRS